MPARKLAGAAIAAASNSRLMVTPPEVSATSEPGPVPGALPPLDPPLELVSEGI
jgi:hypothetical protein